MSTTKRKPLELAQRAREALQAGVAPARSRDGAASEMTRMLSALVGAERAQALAPSPSSAERTRRNARHRERA